jgi:hypothetical protein
MTQATKILKIRPPAAIHQFFGHDQDLLEIGGNRQVKNVQKNTIDVKRTKNPVRSPVISVEFSRGDASCTKPPDITAFPVNSP